MAAIAGRLGRLRGERLGRSGRLPRDDGLFITGARDIFGLDSRRPEGVGERHAALEWMG